MAGQPVKILYLVSGVFARGGIERYARAQVQALRELPGSELRLLSLGGPTRDGFETPFAVDYASRGPSPAGWLAFAAHSAAVLQRWRPDVLWMNHVHFLPLGISGAPTRIVNIYGLELWWRYQAMIAWLLPRCTHVLADCHFAADYAAQRYRVSPQRLSVVWDPVDTARFKPLDLSPEQRQELLAKHNLPVDAQARIILTLGRLSSRARHKGYDRLLDAMHTLGSAGGVVCLLAGDGDDRPRLEQRVAAEGLAGRVFFLGGIPESELAQVYNLAHVFCLVSDRGHGRGEGVPLTPLEAAACGVPIIVGDEDGSKEAVEQGENGFIVSPRRPQELLDALRSLLEDDALRLRMGQAARKRIEGHFSYEVFREKTYRSLEMARRASV